MITVEELNKICHEGFAFLPLEAISKPQIRLKSPAIIRRDEQYILKRFATQLLGLRWGFETISSIFRNNI
jgi:hypothetical protein